MEHSDEYKEFLGSIVKKIKDEHCKTMKVVNNNMVQLYWDIGKDIYEKGEWGKSIVEDLSITLKEKFTGEIGYSPRNLWRMRNFYLTYQKYDKVPPMVADVSWTKTCVILEKCKDPNEREFYFNKTRKYGWSKEELLHNISIHTYADRETEAVYEELPIMYIQRFMYDTGGIFAYVGSQYKILINSARYTIDLLLYNKVSKYMFAIDFKIGNVRKRDVDHLQLYMDGLDQQKLSDQNSSVGIIIYRSKDGALVDYVLKNITENELPKDIIEKLVELASKL